MIRTEALAKGSGAAWDLELGSAAYSPALPGILSLPHDDHYWFAIV